MWSRATKPCRWRGAGLTLFLVPLIAAVLFLPSSPSLAQTAPPPGDPKANIGFGATVSDAEILMLLQRHGVTPQAVFMWTSGLTGTHRTYKTESAEAFLQEMRAHTVESFEKGLQSSVIRLRRFAKVYTEEQEEQAEEQAEPEEQTEEQAEQEEQVMASETLQTEARSLLNIRAQLEAGLTAAKEGKPLIYSVEVSGSSAQLEALSQDPMVKLFQTAMVINGKTVVPHTPKPSAYEPEYLDPAVQALSVGELYQRIKALARSHKIRTKT